MNFLIRLFVGGVIGWLASMPITADDLPGMPLDAVTGIVGATPSGWFISPLVGMATTNQDSFSLPAMLVSFIGAVVLLSTVNLARRGRLR